MQGESKFSEAFGELRFDSLNSDASAILYGILWRSKKDLVMNSSFEFLNAELSEEEQQDILFKEVRVEPAKAFTWQDHE